MAWEEQGSHLLSGTRVFLAAGKDPARTESTAGPFLGPHYHAVRKSMEECLSERCRPSC